jgi:hypothetical protein
MAKAARKRDTGLAVVTQDISDLLSTDLGRIVIANSATQLLMRQAPQVVDAVAEAFHLTDAERSLISTARRGEVLLLGGSDHVPVEVVASAAESRLITDGLGFERIRDED